MQTAATEAQHQCSCGRTFRHGISLKRHQKVSGCADSPLEAVIAEAPSLEAALRSTHAVPTTARTVEAEHERFQDETPTSVTITAQQIARWQEQTTYRPVAAPVYHETSSPSVDWDALKATSHEFVEFSCEQVSLLGRVLASVAGLGARFALFGGFLVALGWLFLFGISENLSAAPASARDRAAASELAARSTVTSFLQTVQLDQYQRATGFLTTRTRETVTADDLQSMFGSLTLEQAARSVSAELGQDGRVATVTIVRARHSEIYTLVQESQGWGLASVAVRRS